jgi:hypothetical protein
VTVLSQKQFREPRSAIRASTLSLQLCPPLELFRAFKQLRNSRLFHLSLPQKRLMNCQYTYAPNAALIVTFIKMALRPATIFVVVGAAFDEFH